jgi:serine protease Do
MVDRIKQILRMKRFGPMALGIAALVFVFGGFAIAGVFHWPGSQEAKAAGKEMTLPASAAVSPSAPTVPGSFADLAQKLSPTVVNVKVIKIEKAGPFPQFPDGPFGEFFKQFPMNPQAPESRRSQGTGSGVIISQDGYILTNNHVVEGATEVTVTVGDTQEFKAQVVGRDPKTDLAVLKIQPKGTLAVASLGNSEQLKVGDWVLAIGNPFGLSHTVTSGIVSAKGRVIGAGPYDNFIQTDASINPGNSGGPLFNMKGEVVGINTAILPSGQGIGFAIPIDTAKPLIPQLVAKGEVTRGYLGVNIQSLTPDLAKALKLGEQKGALVGDVVAGSPADQAGMKRGDVIVAFNSKPVAEARDLSAQVAATKVGQAAAVTVLRNGAKQQLTVKIGQLQSEKAELEKPGQPDQSKWGLQLQDLTPQMAARMGVKTGEGIAVAGVKPGSPAERAGVRPGDLIMEMDHQPVHSVQEARQMAAKNSDQDALLLLVQRENSRFFAAMTM